MGLSHVITIACDFSRSTLAEPMLGWNIPNEVGCISVGFDSLSSLQAVRAIVLPSSSIAYENIFFMFVLVI